MFLLAQNIVVAVIVGGCTVFALWSLMPAAARRAVANRALRLPLPSTLAARLRRAAQPANGCGCDGCDRAAPQAVASATTKPLTFHPRQRR